MLRTPLKENKATIPSMFWTPLRLVAQAAILILTVTGPSHPPRHGHFLTPPTRPLHIGHALPDGTFLPQSRHTPRCGEWSPLAQSSNAFNLFKSKSSLTAALRTTHEEV